MRTKEASFDPPPPYADVTTVSSSAFALYCNASLRITYQVITGMMTAQGLVTAACFRMGCLRSS
jgi:hypothetical protein